MSLILTAGQSKDWWPGRLEVDKTKPFTSTGPYLPLQTHLQWTYRAPPGFVPSLAHETRPLTQTGTPAWSIAVIFQPVRWHRAMKDEKHCVNLGVWMVHLGTETCDFGAVLHLRGSSLGSMLWHHCAHLNCVLTIERLLSSLRIDTTLF